MKIDFQTLKYNSSIKTQKLNQAAFCYASTPIKDSFSYNNNLEELSFGASCSTDKFRIKQIKNIRCPACGQITMTEGDEEVYKSHVAPKTGQELIDAIDKYGDESYWTKKPNPQAKTIYRPEKQKVLEVIKELALEYPNLTLSKLVAIQGVRCMSKLIDKQFVVINELYSYIDESGDITKDEKEKLNQIFNNHSKRALNVSETRFKRKNFIKDIKNADVSPKIKKDVLEIAEKLPTSNTDTDSFFVKYMTRSSDEIASKFVHQNVPTAEHMVCHSKSGKDDTTNYICDCAECNSKRSDTPFYEWSKTIPDFDKNLQDYLQDVYVAYCCGELNKDYDTYIEDIIALIDNLSCGEIKLEQPKLSPEEEQEYAIIKNEKMLTNTISHLNNLQVRQEALKKEIKALQLSMLDEVDDNATRKICNKISGLDKQLYFITDRYLKLSEQKRAIEAELAHLKGNQ